MKLLLTLFFEFFKTGLFSIGGGMATLPFLYDMGERHPDWFTPAQLADMIAVSESTPGPIGVNMATYVGFRTAGVLGGLFATIGLVTPSVIVVLLIARALKEFRSNPYVDAAFYGLRPCSIGLIAAAGLLVVRIALFHWDALGGGAGWWKYFFNWKALILAAVLLVFTRGVKATKKLHPIVFILASAAAGVGFSF